LLLDRGGLLERHCEDHSMITIMLIKGLNRKQINLAVGDGTKRSATAIRNDLADNFAGCAPGFGSLIATKTFRIRILGMVARIVPFEKTIVSGVTRRLPLISDLTSIRPATWTTSIARSDVCAEFVVRVC
jgi:hypothetical protein